MLVRAVLVIAVLAMLVAIFYGEENWRGRHAWDAYRTAAEKRGVRLFLKDFIPPDIPDAENYAAAPVIHEVFAKEVASDRAGPFAIPISSGQIGRMPRGPDDIKGRRFDAAGWREFFLKSKLIPSTSDSAPADILRALAKYEPALQQLRDRLSCPSCKFPTRWEQGVSAPLPHLSAMQGASRLLVVEANAYLQLGDSAAAFSQLRHLVRIHDALRSEPSLIAGLVRISFLSMFEGVVWDGLTDGRWRDDDLAALENLLASLTLAEDCRFAIASERGYANAALADLARRRYDMLHESMKPMRDLGMAPDESIWARLALDAVPSGWFFQLIVHTNRYYDWVLSKFNSGTDALAVSFPSAAFRSTDWVEANPPPFDIHTVINALTSSIPGIVDSVWKKYRYTDVRTRETRLACALERFHHATGTFPGKLEQLIPKFIAAVPLDPFAKEPLCYRLNQDGGYDLWSIGPDGKDDGGKIDPEKNGDEQPDWIWHMPGRMEAR